MSSIDFNQLIKNQDEEIKQLRECINNLEKENEELKIDVNDLLNNQKYNEELEKDYEELKKENEEFKKSNFNNKVIEGNEYNKNRVIVKSWITKCIMDNIYFCENFKIPEKYEKPLDDIMKDFHKI